MADSLFSYVKLLCHCDGADGSTTVTDVIGHTPTVSGASISTTNAAPGFGQSLYVPGGSVSFPSSSDFDLPGDFTLEFRARVNNLAGSSLGSILHRGVSSGAGSWHIGGNSDYSSVVFFVGESGGNAAYGNFGAYVSGQWESYRIVRSGGTVYCFKNGTLTSTVAGATRALNAAAALCIGGPGFFGSAANFNIDEIRLSVGVSRGVSNYTVDTEPFPDQAAAIVETVGDVTAQTALNVSALSVLFASATVSATTACAGVGGSTHGSVYHATAFSTSAGLAGGTFPLSGFVVGKAKVLAQALSQAQSTGVVLAGNVVAVKAAALANSECAVVSTAELFAATATLAPSTTASVASSSGLGFSGMVRGSAGEVAAGALAAFDSNYISKSPSPPPDLLSQCFVRTTERALWTTS